MASKLKSLCFTKTSTIENTLRTSVGDIEDSGRLVGLTKFDGAGGSLSREISVGMEKSSISLFNTIPVDGESIPAPK